MVLPAGHVGRRNKLLHLGGLLFEIASVWASTMPALINGFFG